MDLLIEPFGGFAGDMFLAALLDLGDPRFRLEDLRGLAERLGPFGLRLETQETRRSSLRALHLEVKSEESEAPPTRHLADLVELLDRAALSPRARARAVAVLERLAQAEAAAHGIAIDEVHFHEVGAVDTLLDVAGAVFALECLEIERVLATRAYVGGGRVRCAHGDLPVPAPGTEALLEGLAYDRGPGGERVTPTGAALLAELVDAHEPGRLGAARARGSGAGTRDPEAGPPNLMRVSLREPADAERRSTRVDELACNLDDATGEELGFLLERLRSAGALDVWVTPVQMKKGRPGVQVGLLSRPEGRAALEEVLFTHSPTLGLRWTSTERVECARESLRIELAGEEVHVKVRRRPGAEVLPLDLSPEYEDLARLVLSQGGTLRSREAEARTKALEVLRERASDQERAR